MLVGGSISSGFGTIKTAEPPPLEQTCSLRPLSRVSPRVVGGVGGKAIQKWRQQGELGLGLTQRSKYVFVLSIIPSHLQLEDVEWEDWE